MRWEKTRENLPGAFDIVSTQPMPISKSTGVTPTERMLADLCEKSFLKLWSYPNVFKEDGKEFSDLLVVFEKHVFIFFDREAGYVSASDLDVSVRWDRWKRNVIDSQIKTAHGAGRYLKSGRRLFLDSKCLTPFPVKIGHEGMVVHKIIVAHGVKEACEQFSDENIYGSLGIFYGESDGAPSFPFMLYLDKHEPVHVFDTHNLPIILGELNTVFDFSSYLDAKLDAIKALDSLMYCGEEDLLAHYYGNFDESKKRHFIGTKDPAINGVVVGEGEWRDFVGLDLYKNTKLADEASYIWDYIIQVTAENTLNGRLLGDGDPLGGRSAIHEMAKEPRFIRRALSEWMMRTIKSFPDSANGLMRHVAFMPSFYPGKGYVFLQLKVDAATRLEPDFRDKRRAILEIACGAAKNRLPDLKMVVGIGIEAPKFVREVAEDFLLMDCDNWTAALREHYEEANKGWDFFRSSQLKETYRKVTQFLPAEPGGNDQK